MAKSHTTVLDAARRSLKLNSCDYTFVNFRMAPAKLLFNPVSDIFSFVLFQGIGT